MSTTYVDAINEMYKLVATTIAAASSSVGTGPVDVRYLGRDLNTVGDVTKFMAEVSQIGRDNNLRGFGVSDRLYTQTGDLRVKVYAPKAVANNFNKARLFSDAIKNAFRERKVVASVWYRNARVIEMMPERGAYRFDVAVAYSYDERQ